MHAQAPSRPRPSRGVSTESFHELVGQQWREIRNHRSPASKPTNDQPPLGKFILFSILPALHLSNASQRVSKQPRLPNSVPTLPIRCNQTANAGFPNWTAFVLPPTPLLPSGGSSTTRTLGNPTGSSPPLSISVTSETRRTYICLCGLHHV